MNDIQQKMAELQSKGWTLAALADELGVTASAMDKWKAGDKYPGMPRPILVMFDQIAKRKKIPKQRRYAKGSRKRASA